MIASRNSSPLTRSAASKSEDVTSFGAITITIAAPASDAIRLEAAKFGKTPETYCCGYMKWFALMQLDGKP